MIDRGPGAGFRWSLHTRDAHDLYRKYGFAEPDTRYMERPRRPDHPTTVPDAPRAESLVTERRTTLCQALKV